MNDAVERELEAGIEPWLEHMRWRADFEAWRRKRLWQENYQAAEVAEVRRGAGALAAEGVLDLGAGMGGFAVALARENCPVVAMDYNPAYCEITRLRARRYDLNLPVLVGQGEALPFADQRFGVVACWDVVEHVQDPVALFAEIARVLKPNGRAFITVINRLALVDPHYHLRFLNWLPRPLAEDYIALRHRTKNGPLRDRQRLSEMHYFTFGSAVRLGTRFGLRAQDLLSAKSRFNRLPRPAGQALYGLWRTLGMGTFRLLFVKEGQATPEARMAGGQAAS